MSLRTGSNLLAPRSKWHSKQASKDAISDLGAIVYPLYKAGFPFSTPIHYYSIGVLFGWVTSCVSFLPTPYPEGLGHALCGGCVGTMPGMGG